jgi:hypothetical protein
MCLTHTYTTALLTPPPRGRRNAPVDALRGAFTTLLVTDITRALNGSAANTIVLSAQPRDAASGGGMDIRYAIYTNCYFLISTCLFSVVVNVQTGTNIASSAWAFALSQTIGCFMAVVHILYHCQRLLTVSRRLSFCTPSSNMRSKWYRDALPMSSVVFQT